MGEEKRGKGFDGGRIHYAMPGAGSFITLSSIRKGGRDLKTKVNGASTRTCLALLVFQSQFHRDAFGSLVFLHCKNTPIVTHQPCEAMVFQHPHEVDEHCNEHTRSHTTHPN